MGLISESQDDLKGAFDTDLSDVVTNLQLVKTEQGEYLPATGIHRTNTTRCSSRGIFEDFGTKEMLRDAEIKVGDKKIIIIANEILNEPGIDDIIETFNKSYTVIKNKNVFDVTYEVQVRVI